MKNLIFQKISLLVMVLLVVLLLAACSGQAVTTSTPLAGATQAEQLPTATLSQPAQQAVELPPTPAASEATEQLPPVPSGCTVVTRQFSSEPTQQSLFPAVTDADWVIGEDTAAMTLVEYADFQCPSCATLATVLADFQKEYPQDVRLVFRHFPLIGTPDQPFHDKAALSAQAAEAAGLQGKFWEMHHLLYARQGEWTSLTVDQFRPWLFERAAELSLDVERFMADLDSEALVSLVQGAWDWGLQVGMPGTPFLLLNGKIWDMNVPLTYFNLSAVIKLTLLEQRQFDVCPPITIDATKRYTATIKTEKGDIVLELFPDKAPIAVNSFIFLARNGWYDGLTFHRVIPDYIAQAGDPTGTGFGGPGYAFMNEVVAGLEFDREGVLAMANAGEGSNGSQFFITYGPATQLNGKYTIFGRVLSGMDVLRSLTPRNPEQDASLRQLHHNLVLACLVQIERCSDTLP